MKAITAEEANEKMLDISERDIEDMKDLFQTILFKEKHGQKRAIRCSRCETVIEEGEVRRAAAGEWYEASNKAFVSKHLDCIICPSCKRNATLIESGRIKNTDRHEEWNRIVFFTKITKESTMIRAYSVRRYMYRDIVGRLRFAIEPVREGYFALYPKIAEEFVYDRYGKAYTLKGRYEGFGGVCKIFGTVGNPFSRHNDKWYHFVERGEMKNTFLRFFPREYVINRYDECVALSAYAAFPAIEMLMKLGYTCLVDDLIFRKVKNSSFCNIAAKEIKDVFPSLQKNELKVWRETNVPSAYKAKTTLMQMYMVLRKAFPKRTESENMKEAAACLNNPFYGICNSERDAMMTCRMIAKAKIRYAKFEKYIKELKAEADTGEKPFYANKYQFGKQNLEDYFMDYMKAAKDAGFDLTREDVLLPKNIAERHDAAISIQTAKACEVITKNMEKVSEKNEFLYHFENEKYIVVVPKSIEAIINEGKIQGHCVGGYADRHARGVLTILFVRNKENQSLPLYTVEMRGDVLMQMRGFRNRDPEPEALEFMRKLQKAVPERIEEWERKNKSEEGKMHE